MTNSDRMSRISPFARRSTMESILTQGSLDTISQWEEIMRRFSDDCKKKRCKVHDHHIRAMKKTECQSADTVDLSCGKLPQREFLTGSTYDGTWDALGMNGHGVYTFPNGVIYEGGFEDGDFHGEGELRYPDGIKILGLWWHGQIKHRTVVFADGTNYTEDNWKYCCGPDRRFAAEYRNGIKGAEAKDRFLTPTQPPRDIPEGWYDTCDGLYDPETRTVFTYENLLCAVRGVTDSQHEWITKNCRTNPERFGPCSDLYKDQPGPEQELPDPPSPPALLSPNKSVDSSIDSLLKGGDVGAAWSKMVKNARDWSKRVIQFDDA